MNIEDDLCVICVNFYNYTKEEGVTYIPDTAVAKYALLKKYYLFIQYGYLQRIEDIPTEEKIELTTECRNIEMKDRSGKTERIRFTNETLTDYCRILHVIKFINNNT